MTSMLLLYCTAILPPMASETLQTTLARLIIIMVKLNRTIA